MCYCLCVIVCVLLCVLQVEEFIALADGRLSLFGDEVGVEDADVHEQPQHKITDFT